MPLIATAKKLQYLINMNCIDFNDVSFTYPPVQGDVDSDGKQIAPKPVFSHFTGSIPQGFTSLIGANGSGKTTFMLLEIGRASCRERV